MIFKIYKTMKPTLKRTAKLYNYELFDPLKTEGIFDIPRIQGVNALPSRLIPFHQAVSFRGDASQIGVHFLCFSLIFDQSSG